MVALLESQSFGTKIHKNSELLVNFCPLVTVLRFLNLFPAEIANFTFS